MKRILSIADSIENTRYSAQRCVDTYNDFNVESMLAVPEFTGEESAEQTDIGEVLDYCFSQELDAVFIGMIRNPNAVKTVASKLMQYDHPAVVAEPTIISPEGKILVSRETYDAIVGSLIQNIHFLTLNIYEAELLSGIECHGPADARQAAEAICEKYHCVVFICGCRKTGGRDLFVMAGKVKWFDGSASHSASTRKLFTVAVAGELAAGKDIKDAVTASRLYCGISSGVEEDRDTGVVFVSAASEKPVAYQKPAEPKPVEPAISEKIIPEKIVAVKTEERDVPSVAPVSSLVSPAKSIRDAVRNFEPMPSRIKFGSGISIPSNGVLARELAKKSSRGSLTAVTSGIESEKDESASGSDSTSISDMFDKIRRLSEM